jgi:hypothetical protein
MEVQSRQLLPFRYVNMHIDTGQQVSVETVYAACIADSDRPILQCWETSLGVHIANHRACDVVG